MATSSVKVTGCGLRQQVTAERRTKDIILPTEREVDPSIEETWPKLIIININQTRNKTSRPFINQLMCKCKSLHDPKKNLRQNSFLYLEVDCRKQSFIICLSLNNRKVALSSAINTQNASNIHISPYSDLSHTASDLPQCAMMFILIIITAV